MNQNQQTRKCRSVRGSALLELAIILPFLLGFTALSLLTLQTVRVNQDLSMLTNQLANVTYRLCLDTISEVDDTCAPHAMVIDPAIVPAWSESDLESVPAAALCRQHAFQACVTEAINNVDQLPLAASTDTELRVTVARPVADPIAADPDRTALAPIYAESSIESGLSLCEITADGFEQCVLSENTYQSLLRFGAAGIHIIAEVNRPYTGSFLDLFFNKESYEVGVI